MTITNIFNNEDINWKKKQKSKTATKNQTKTKKGLVLDLAVKCKAIPAWIISFLV